MSVNKVYKCDCCAYISPRAIDFNNAPGNKLIPAWYQINGHYCNDCINKFNNAIGLIFKKEKSKNVKRN